MADGEITLRLDANTSRLLKEAADAEGVTPEDLGARVIADRMIDQIEGPDDIGSGLVDPDPAIDDRIVRETIERGDGIPLDDVLTWLDSWGKPDERPVPASRRK
jgi:predicted transcriptional regulator